MGRPTLYIAVRSKEGKLWGILRIVEIDGEAARGERWSAGKWCSDPNVLVWLREPPNHPGGYISEEEAERLIKEEWRRSPS